MEKIRVGRTIKVFFFLTAVVFSGVTSLQAADVDVATISLTQTGCQFLEPEGVDHKFIVTKAADCKAINKKSGKERLKNTEPLRLKAGTYIFRVTNKNVTYPLGFWLRGKGLQGATLPSVSGGGLTLGKTNRYAITLEPGEYIYSCPLNPTPDYPLVVE